MKKNIFFLTGKLNKKICESVIIILKKICEICELKICEFQKICEICECFFFKYKKICENMWNMWIQKYVNSQ